MAKQLNVNLNYTANTTQAQQALNQLSVSLNSIANITPTVGAKLSQDLQIAKQSAQELQQHLINAFNVKTGNLDLSRLDASLKSAGQSLGGLSTNLLKAGTTGQQAFLNIQRAISNASVQINQANGMLAQFWTTLQNTARWQISSSILHGFVSSLQSAWGYAKKLDKSLNDIRIVTGYNAGKMAEFAEQANKAAKALSTTTTDFTNASLIYYQQGLSEKEVLERAAITVKMANVTGKNTQEVSDQLTAIWNNFDDGSKSLEYYVDVITALGAATASSTDEISQGLEKFAAVAETAGLSYEYATAALATVTAETRQSADVVGTAFKTLFARIQGLALGETLDDGTTLNKYSEALMKVGINIKDSNGELKDMDIILNEMGAKWNNLARDQQVALAQVVGGIRQYNQLIALMDNWDVFQTNLQTIETSTGALQQQADIYADSWEAASNRVRAAAEGIYRDLFPTEELTGVADGFATFLQGIDGLVRGLGGLKGILLLISSIVLNSFQNQIGTAIDNAISKVASLSSITINLKNSFTGVVGSTKNLSNTLDQIRSKTQDGAAQVQIFEEHLSRSASLATKNSNAMGKAAINTLQLSDSFRQYSSNLLEVNNIQALIENSSRYLTSEQKQQLSLLQQQALAANEQLLIAQDEYQLAQQRSALMIHSAGDDISDTSRFRVNENEVDKPITNFDSRLYANGSNLQDVQEMNTLWQQITGAVGDAAMTVEAYRGHVSMALGTTTDLETINKQVKVTYADIYTANRQIQTILQSAKKDINGNVELTKEEEDAVRSIVGALKQKSAAAETALYTINEEEDTIKDIASGVDKLTSKMRNYTIATGSSEAHIQEMEASILRTEGAFQKQLTAVENFKNKILQVTTTLQNGLANAMSVGHIASSMASGFSTIAMGISSVTNAMKTFEDEEASFATKLTSGAIAATMGVSALMAAIKGISSFIESINIAMGISNGIKAINIALTKEKINLATKEGKAKVAELIVEKLKIAEDKKEAATKVALQMLDKQDIKTTYEKVAADYANVTSQAAKLWYITLIIAAITALIAITVALINKESEEEAQLRKSLAVQEDMNEEMEKSKTVAEDIKSVFDEYTTIVDKLKSCTKGTKEWNDLLTEVQNKVFEIMRDFPELANKYENLFIRDPATGLLTIDESQIERIVDDYIQAASIDSFQATVSTLRAQQASLDEKATYLIPSEATNEGRSRVAVSEAGASKNVSVEYDYHKLLRKNMEDLANLSEEEFKTTFINLLKDTGDTMTKTETWGIANYSQESVSVTDLTEQELNALADAASEYKDTIDELSQSSQQYAQALDNTYDLIVQQLVPNENSEIQNLASAQTRMLERKYENAYKNLMTSNARSNGEYGMSAAEASRVLVGDTSLDVGINQGSEKDNEIYKYILSELQKYGKNWIADTENAVQGTDGERFLQFVDENGKQVRKSAEWIAQELASSRALAEITDSVSAANKLLSEINTNILNANFGNSNSAEGQQNAFKAILTNQSLDGATVGDVNSLFGAVDGLIFQDGKITQGDTDKQLTKEEVHRYLDKIIGDGLDGTLDDTSAQDYGFDSADDMVNVYYQVLQSAGQKISSLAIKGPIGEEFLNKMSLETANALENQFNNLSLGPMGAKAGEEYIDGLNEMINTVSKENKIEAFNQLSQINWADEDALKQAEAIVQSLGGKIDIAGDEWIKYAEDMSVAAGAIPDFSKLSDTLKNISSILQSLDFGSIIDEEDYQKLVQYKEEWKEFFMLQADGTRAFIGDSQMMQQQARGGIIEDRAELQKRRAIQEDFNNVRWGKNGESTNWANMSGSNVATAKNLKDSKSGGATQNMLEILGYTDEVISGIIEQAESEDEDIKAEGQARLREMYQRIDSFTKEDLAAVDTDFDERLASTATNVNDLQELLNTGQISEESYDKQLSVMANNAKTLEELQQIQKAGLGEDDLGKAGLDTYEYGQALLNLASNYENCTKEAEAYSRALSTGNKAEIQATQTALEAAIEVGELAEKYDLSAEELESYSKRLQDLHKESNLSAKDANQLAVSNMRLDKGMSNLNDNLEDYKKRLKDTNKGTAEWSDTLSDVKTDLADMLNIANGDLLSDSFAESTLESEDLKKALDGDVDAILRLKLAAADDIIANLNVDDSALNTVQDNWNYIKGIIETEDINAPRFNQANLINSFNELIAAGRMTKEQIESTLAGLNIGANIHTDYIGMPQNVPSTITETKTAVTGETEIRMPDGSTHKATNTITESTTYPGPTYEQTVWVPQYSIEGTKGPGGITTGLTQLPPPKASGSSTSSGKNNGGGGGGGSSPKKADKVKKKDVVDRYKEVTDSLDDNADAIERANRAAEKLYGKDRINYMREANELLQEEIGLLEQKREEAERYLQEDGDTLATAAAEAGINFTFDDKGNIINYTEEMTKLYNQLNNAITRANADGNADEAEQEAIDKIQEKIDNVQDALADYEETRETIEDIDKELEEKLTKWQDANFEILNAELELKIELNEKELERVEYYLEKIEEDFYSMAEAASLMSDRENGQLGIHLSDLRAQEEYVQSLSQAYAAGEISEAKYVEGLSNANSTIYEKLNNLKELDTTMKEYYSETLSMASEELAKYTDLMSHSTSVLEHYYSIAEMLGKSTDYAYLKQILQGQSEVAKQTYIASKANYEMLKAQAQDRQQAYENALANGASEEQLKFLEQQWWDAQTAANEAQDQMLSDAQAWGESLRAVLDNELSDISQNLENILAEGFGSFDAMNTAFERRNSLQEEYLTTTNKIYETNKMMRTAQQQIDKTTNQMAKNKLKQFINETSAMQKQGKLSQYELDIQQAKYQLLLAEIALKEAQNAKSTVRLQRDSEGNFGYVYTADQNKIAEAQQQFEDAENALYNKALEGANNYVQKYQETMAEMQDTLTQMHQDYLDGAYESEEEYNRAIEEAKEYYYQKMLDYSDLYKVAVETDAKAAEEAWSSEFATITDNTDYYMQEVSRSIGIAKTAIDEWKTSMETISEETLGDIATSVQDVVNESQDLASAVTEQVIPALEEQLNAVTNITDAYASYKDSLSDIIEKYEDMARESQNIINSLANVEAQARETARAISTAYTATPSTGGTGGPGGTGDTGGTNPGSYVPPTIPEKTMHQSGTYSGNVRTTLSSKDSKVLNGVYYTRVQINGTDYWIKNTDMTAGQYLGGSTSGSAFKVTNVPKFQYYDTGGYTGEWGSYGKMAMLHEKELVLNANDTENFLASMEFLHKILETIDLQAASSQLGGILSSPNLNHNNSNIIEQDVHIEATFPNVTNHSEIEEAFNNLINTSSQYAFKR